VDVDAPPEMAARTEDEDDRGPSVFSDSEMMSPCSLSPPTTFFFTSVGNPAAGL
jgi:hypothetical protein